METQIILLSGKQGAGKTAISEALARKVADDFKSFMFAPFKYIQPIAEAHDLVRKYLHENYDLPPLPVKDGPLMQVMGLWAVNMYGTDIWARIAHVTVQHIIERHSKIDGTFDLGARLLIVNDDCRRPEEFDAFPKALRVRLTAPREVRKVRATSWREDENHISEIALDQYEAEGKFDMVLSTDGPTVEDTVQEILAKLQNRTGWKL